MERVWDCIYQKGLLKPTVVAYGQKTIKMEKVHYFVLSCILSINFTPVIKNPQVRDSLKDIVAVLNF